MTEIEQKILDFLKAAEKEAGINWPGFYTEVCDKITEINTELFYIQCTKGHREQEKREGIKPISPEELNERIGQTLKANVKKDPDPFYYPGYLGKHPEEGETYFNDEKAFPHLLNALSQKYPLPKFLKSPKDILQARCTILAIKKAFSILAENKISIPNLGQNLMAMLLDITNLTHRAGLIMFEEELERGRQSKRRSSQTSKTLNNIKKHKSYPLIKKIIIKLNEAIAQGNKRDEKKYKKQIFEKVSKIIKGTEKTKKRYTNLIIKDFNN